MKDKPGADREDGAVMKRLLGSLELKVMEILWQRDEATVRQVADLIRRERAIAYTTVMTVMGHLADKGLLTRVMDGRQYRYRITQSKDEFLREAARTRVHALVEDFGDLAMAGFLGEIDGIGDEQLKQLRRLAEEAPGGNDAPG